VCSVGSLFEFEDGFIATFDGVSDYRVASKGAEC